jgi:hypothetical protein
MVWPILISAGVTPRISAALDAAGQAKQASAPIPPMPVTKRIDTPSPAISGHGYVHAPGTTKPCHDANSDANRNPPAITR